MTIIQERASQLRSRLQEASRRLQQVVYFIEARHEQKLVKIGTAIHAPGRLRDLQIGSPVRLRLVLTVPGDAVLEKELHEKFRDHRLHGEWFAPSTEMRAYILDCRREDTRSRLMYERRVDVSRRMAWIRKDYSDVINAQVKPMEGEFRS